MAEPDIKAGLRSLRKSLEQIKALLAWDQLKKAEATAGRPSAFKFYDQTERDLRNEYSFFLFTSLQLHGVLNDSSISISQTERQSIKKQLLKLEQQIHGLSLPRRLCSC
jgi:hypothetical protein